MHKKHLLSHTAMQHENSSFRSRIGHVRQMKSCLLNSGARENFS